MKAALTSALLIFTAEVGDKTQLFVAALAGKYAPGVVVSGVLTGIAAVQGVAVTVGKLLTDIVPIDWVQLASGAAFLAFAIWSLPEGEDEKAARIPLTISPFFAIAGSFFIAELGDKTQLAAVALSARYGQPFQVWLGALLGMATADCLGLVAGYLLARTVKENTVKQISSAVFALFAVSTIWATVPQIALRWGLTMLAAALYVTAFLAHRRRTSNHEYRRKVRK
ncbi:MAG TPA: TMEM165/GDT1 family protein [Firmicutes bacterium]|nr:TMEM165/GDT1 family protein [Bacillota bacterium]